MYSRRLVKQETVLFWIDKKLLRWRCLQDNSWRRLLQMLLEFLKMNSLFHPSFYVSTEKKKFTHYKQSLSGPLFLSLVKKTDQTMFKYFLLRLKRKNSQVIKSNSCKKLLLQCVCYWYSLLRWIGFYSWCLIKGYCYLQ